MSMFSRVRAQDGREGLTLPGRRLLPRTCESIKKCGIRGSQRSVSRLSISGLLLRARILGPKAADLAARPLSFVRDLGSKSTPAAGRRPIRLLEYPPRLPEYHTIKWALTNLMPAPLLPPVLVSAS